MRRPITSSNVLAQIKNPLFVHGPVPAALAKGQFRDQEPDMVPSQDQSGSFQSEVTTVRALWDFLSTDPGELQFRKGDIISVVRYTHEDWWEGRLHGRTGLFPCMYVESCPSSMQRFSAVVHPPSSPVSMEAPGERSNRWSNSYEAASYPPSEISRESSPLSHAGPTVAQPVYSDSDMYEEPPQLTGQHASHGSMPHSVRSDGDVPYLLNNTVRSDEDKAWDDAQEYSFAEPGDLSNLRPDVRQELSLAAKAYMPRPSSKEALETRSKISRKAVPKPAQPPASSPEISRSRIVERKKEKRVVNEDEGQCCRDARKAQKLIYFCSPCDSTFCDVCWKQQRAHRPRNEHSTGPPHVKTDPTIAEKIERTLQADLDDASQAMLHLKDEDTSWFGAGKDEQDEIVFQDYGRYANLMAERAARHRKLRYPALTSFVGQTGAGKSTLIRLLIELQAPDVQYPQVPVVGSVRHPDIPTSGDVHLYCDPRTSETKYPVLYADCEGLDGGAREPMGAKSRRRYRRDGSGHEHKKKTNSFVKHIRRKHNTSEREVLWATTDEKRSRDYHVRHLYPRLLYTFSDVIIFVTREARVIENVIDHLVQWAAAALETSSNQPVLPHAIIVLNAAAHGTDAKLWDVNNSTTALLESVRRALQENHKFRKHAEFWQQKKKHIASIQDLLLSYYSSIRVVRVPVKGWPSLINEQLQKLYKEITGAAEQARTSKHKLRMLLNSDELDPYLQYAFDHFCRDLDVPFDFVQASFAHNPIPSDFGGNILKLAINIMDVWKDKVDGPYIFKELSFIVASCIMLESARHRQHGSAEQVFPEYLVHCDVALDDFCQRYWPCEYVGLKGRCVNVKAGHTKGHQLKNGQVVAVGEYYSSFSSATYRDVFRHDVYSFLAVLLETLQDVTQNSKESEVQEAANIHRDLVLRNFFHHLNGPKNFISHTACFSCLISPPEHPLPCGHILCTPCVKVFGEARGRATFDMKYCPLHRKDEPEGQFEYRWPTVVKPSGAGIRVLSLDGGGIRGIVELVTLQQIQSELGIRLPVQAFFDLIVGTSTGGVIALGLGSKGWSVQKCKEKFMSLCKDAFTKRKGIGVPIVESIVSASNHSRYETKPLENALRDAFGEESLFGGVRDLSDNNGVDRTTKVAVTTTTTNGKVFLLTNYNRINSDDSSAYQFHRAEKPHREILIWEAARATSAAPRIFKPFGHEQTGQTFQDGAIYHNCPIEVAMNERKLIWPDMAEAHPDLVLSIGTSYGQKLRRKSLLSPSTANWGIVAHWKQLAKIAIDHVQSTLDCEMTWNKFRNTISGDNQVKDRYIRLNLPLEQDPPRLDEVCAMNELQDETVTYWTTKSKQIKAVADRLLATAFYFETGPAPITENEDQTIHISGSILCRFPPGSEEIRALGEAFDRRSRAAYNSNDVEKHSPYFVIAERKKRKDAVQVPIGQHIVTKMITMGQFSIGKTSLTLSDRLAESEISLCFSDQPRNTEAVFYPISGFPRCLIGDEQRLAVRSRLSLSVGRKRTPTQTDRDAWCRPIDPSKSDIDLIRQYQSPDYLYPGGATSDAISEISQRFSPPSYSTIEYSMNPIMRNMSFTSQSSYNTSGVSRPESMLLPQDVYEMPAELPSNAWLTPPDPRGGNRIRRHEIG